MRSRWKRHRVASAPRSSSGKARTTRCVSRARSWSIPTATASGERRSSRLPVLRRRSKSSCRPRSRPDTGRLEIDESSARALAAWYAFGAELLNQLAAEAGPGDAPTSPIALARALRHRDRARRGGRPDARQLRLLARRRAARRAVRSTSVPWTAEVSGELWNARRLHRRRAGYAELLAAERPARRGDRVLHHQARRAGSDGRERSNERERQRTGQRVRRGRVAPRARGRRAARGPRHHGRRRPQERRARPLRRAVLRARQPLPAPGRPARRGLDRERAAALPVARLRLLPARRQVARLRRRGDHLPARDPRRRGLRRRRGGARTSRPSPT